MQLSIVIINFRYFDLTCNCLKSVKQYVTELQYEIILVDNAPLEDKEKDFKSLIPGLKYIKTSENIGFSKANNLGIENAEGNYILLLNSDTLIFDDSIQQCFDFMETDQNRNIGLLGCKLLNADYSYQPSFYPFINDSAWNFFCVENPVLYKLFKIKQKYAEPTEPIQVGDVSGAFMFLRRAVITTVNAFDPDFFLYSEETEWCRNRIAKFYKICYFPKAAVVHLGGQSTPKSYLFAQSRLSLSLAWYKKGWFSYLLYIFCCYSNLVFFVITYIFLRNKTYYKEYIKTYFSLVPSLIFDIPGYSAQYGSRKEPLIYGKAKKHFQ